MNMKITFTNCSFTVGTKEQDGGLACGYVCSKCHRVVSVVQTTEMQRMDPLSMMYPPKDVERELAKHDATHNPVSLPEPKTQVILEGR